MIKVAIAGATGLTGHLCLQMLLRSPKVSKVIAIGRRPSGMTHPKLQEALLVENRLQEIEPVDAFICCLGTTIKKAGSPEAFRAVDLDLPLYLGRQLKAEGCHAVAVISSMGADANSAFLYTKTKGLMEEGFKALGFRSLAILRPSFIEGHRTEEVRIAEKVGLVFFKALNPLLKGSLKHYRSIPAASIAHALLASVLTAKEGMNVYLSDDIKNL